MTELPNVLFLCTGNSCRSQMAEGWARHLRAADLVAHSAGVLPMGMNPHAIRVMAEVGVDISSHQSKHTDDLRHVHLDLVVAVCDSASQACPVYLSANPRTRFVRQPFADPPALARNAATADEALNHYRRVRDEIGAFVRTLQVQAVTP